MKDLGPLPRLHPRELLVHEAELELLQALVALEKKHSLTEGEMLRVVVRVFGDHVGMLAKYMIREERHPGEDKPGGFA